MTQYVNPEIEQNPTEIQQQMVDDLAENGIEVRPATALYYLLSVFAFLWATLAEQATQVFSTIFRYYGQTIARIPPNDAVRAATTVTFRAKDTNGPYLVPAGTEVNLRAADGTTIPFRTTVDATIPNGATTVTPVTIVAVDGGTDANDLATFATVTQTFAWAGSPVVIVLAPSGGGTDAETDDDYEDRLADLLSLPSRTLAHPANFEVFARNQPGIERALAINNYTPGPPASDAAPGHITVFPIDPGGGTLTDPEKVALLADIREVTLNNLIPHVADPTYTVVEVEFTGVCESGEDEVAVEARAEAAVLEFLDPAVWASPGIDDPRGWEDRPIVRYQDVSHVLNSVEGFDYHTALTINGVAGDLELDGPAALPDPDSTADGTVTAP